MYDYGLNEFLCSLHPLTIGVGLGVVWGMGFITRCWFGYVEWGTWSLYKDW